MYVLERTVATGDLVRARSPEGGEDLVIEAAATRRCVRGRDIRRYGSVDGQVRCVVPYARDGQLWTPEELAEYPRAAAHLQRARPRLDARESGRHAGPEFYRFGRPQNMAFLG